MYLSSQWLTGGRRAKYSFVPVPRGRTLYQKSFLAIEIRHRLVTLYVAVPVINVAEIVKLLSLRMPCVVNQRLRTLAFASAAAFRYRGVKKGRS